MPLLADHFITIYCQRNGREPMTLDQAALDKLTAYDWPGNVRELENVIERAVVLSKDELIGLADLPDSVARAERRSESMQFAIGTPLSEIERHVIHHTLEHTRGDKQLAAQLLGISARTIYRKLAPSGDSGEKGSSEAQES